MTAVPVHEIANIRGSFARTPRENFWPIAYAWLLASIPVGTFVMRGSLVRHPKNSVMDEPWFWPVIVVWFLGMAAYIVYRAFQRYEFDGATVRCIRLGGSVAWAESLQSVQAVRPVPSTLFGLSFRVTWPNRRRTIHAGEALASKLLRLSSDA